MTETAAIIDRFVGDGTQASPNTVSISDHHSVISWQDITGSPIVPISPNSVTIQVIAETAVLDEISNDENFYILWRAANG